MSEGTASGTYAYTGPQRHSWPTTTAPDRPTPSHLSALYERCSVCGGRRFGTTPEEQERARASCPGPGADGIAFKN